MAEYVVRRALKYIHAFDVVNTWVGSECHSRAKAVEWVDVQRLAFRWSDRNHASNVARQLDAHVVRLVSPIRHDKGEP